MAFNPCSFLVGSDGLWIATRIAPWFVPWSEVAAAELYPHGVRVLMKVGPALELPLTVSKKGHNDRFRAQQGALMARVSAALEAHRSSSEPSVSARVARSGRSHAEWLRALFEREASFRSSAVLDDELWSLVESPSAEPSARAGAAAVLARDATEGDRRRLRIAADACAAPRVRVVLEQAASGAEREELARALGALEDEESEPRARASR